MIVNFGDTNSCGIVSKGSAVSYESPGSAGSKVAGESRRRRRSRKRRYEATKQGRYPTLWRLPYDLG